jgi:hypothetical protein
METGNNFLRTYKDKYIKFFIVLALLIMQSNIFAQNSSLYMPEVFKRAYTKGTRSYDGTPGKNYWQNRAEYNIKASFDPATKILKGSEEIVYFNNSPDTLKALVVKIIQDVYKKGVPKAVELLQSQLTDGVNITSLQINNGNWDLANRRQSYRSGTNLRLFLQRDKFIAPGSSVKLNVNWDYKEVLDGMRTGVFTDSSVFLGYWYPQMAVYDDYQGWDVGDYTGNQETYNDLANYNVEITMPANYIIWATGDLLNGTEIFATEILNKIEASKKSKEIVKIIEPGDYKKKIINGNGTVVWKYSAKNVPDFSWAASSYYLWDACSAVSDVKNNKSVWVNSLYPPTGEMFKNVAGWAQKSIEFLSSVMPGIPYLYDKHFTFNGHRLTAMEFPMMANNRDGAARFETYVFELTAHEIAHGYMPFYVLCNEKEFAWMDEGFVKLFGEMALDNKGTKRTESRFLNTIQIYKNLAGTIYDVPLITPSSYLSPANEFATSYAKSATALYYLIEIMQEKGIKNPLKIFMDTWKDKHPIPYDFFFLMNKLAKEDLSWFWKPWYFEFAAPDIAIKEVKKGTDIIIENKGGIPSPVVLKITYNDNTTETIRRSASVWKNGNIYTEKIAGKKKISSVSLGDTSIVDVNPENDSYKVN